MTTTVHPHLVDATIPAADAQTVIAEKPKKYTREEKQSIRKWIEGVVAKMIPVLMRAHPEFTIDFVADNQEGFVDYMEYQFYAGKLSREAINDAISAMETDTLPIDLVYAMLGISIKTTTEFVAEKTEKRGLFSTIRQHPVETVIITVAVIGVGYLTYRYMTRDGGIFAPMAIVPAVSFDAAPAAEVVSGISSGIASFARLFA